MERSLAEYKPGAVASAKTARDYVAAGKAANTLRAYAADWRHFTSWCESRGVTPLPATPETVADYAAGMAETHKPASIGRRLASVSKAHQAAGFDSPCRTALVRDTLAGIRRTHGTAQTRKAAVRVRHLRRAVHELRGDMRDLRDKALLLLGYAGALRRSELVGLDVADLDFTDEGLKLTVRRSKTDQEAAGFVKAIGRGTRADTCPVRALRTWLDAAGIGAGPVFRQIRRGGRVQAERLSTDAVARILKRLAPKLGLDPDQIAGHSLRAGFVTDQYAKGTAEGAIMKHTGHKSRSVMAIYEREADLFAFNYVAAAGL
jgi:integrase